jgi:predicted RNase H-like HicB family nuclease/DNA-binding XRE family transcriptional regulator
MVYHFRVHRDTDGLWAECLELEGCQTQADTEQELRTNAAEALNLYLDEPTESDVRIPLPREVREKGIMEVAPDPGVALSALLRHLRREHNYTQQEVANRLGMKNIYSYQRLERRANPSLATINKIKRVFPELSVDYVLQE